MLTPPGTVGAVDVRGGAPGSRETDLLDPANSVRYVDAVLIAGGSAYGLAAADGVMRWLEEHDRGVAMTGGVVPIVPGAVIFDLDVGAWSHRPTAEFGYAACQTPPAADTSPVGTVGAGVGACAGVLKGGVGTASTTLPSGVTVGALVAVNSAGNVIDQATGLPWLTYLVDEFGSDAAARRADRRAGEARIPVELAEYHHRGGRDRCRAEPGGLPAGRADRSRRTRPQHPAGAYPGGRRHGVRPGHRRHRGAPPADMPAAFSPETPLATAVGAAAADCLARAVLVGVIAAESVAGIPTYRDLLPGAFRTPATCTAKQRTAMQESVTCW